MEEQELKNYKAAGRIVAEAIRKGVSMTKQGESIRKILDEVDNYIHSKGAVPAFPAQISVNNVAAHYCPNDFEETINEGDIIKLDAGASVDGYIADTAKTIDLGGNKELVNATEEALKKALKVVRPGIKIRDIGREIQEEITSRGFSPIMNLSGHGLARYEVHARPTIPNFDNNDPTELEEGQVIAIEPFATNGAGQVYESSNPTVFSLIRERPIRSPITKSVLQEIKKYNGLPFASKWLIQKFGEGKTGFALRELQQLQIVESHPPLLEKNKGKVSQSEHSVIVLDKPVIFTKIDD